jgi:hypothetical protein
MGNVALYMTVKEQCDCLEAAGFGSVTRLLEMRGLVLHRAMHRPETTCSSVRLSASIDDIAWVRLSFACPASG